MADDSDEKPLIKLQPSAVSDLARHKLSARWVRRNLKHMVPVTAGVATVLVFKSILDPKLAQNLKSFSDIYMVGIDPVYAAGLLVGLTIEAVLLSNDYRNKMLRKRLISEDEDLRQPELHPGPWDVEELSAKPCPRWQAAVRKPRL